MSESLRERAHRLARRARAHARPAALPALRALLVARNGLLVAERYYGGASMEQPRRINSATKSVVSLLVDTPWSRERWFATRDSARDYEFTQQMAKDVRRAIEPGVTSRETSATWPARSTSTRPSTLAKA